MKKIFIAITAIILSAGIAVIVSCSKQQEASATIAESKTLLAPSALPLGYASKDGEICFYFDKEEYIRRFEECIKTNLGNNYVLEDVRIFDRDPANPDSIAYLQQTLFNLESGKTTNLFSLLEKVLNGSTMEYILTSDKPRDRDIVCEGENCAVGGCLPNANQTDCTDCGNENGKCKKTSKPNHSGDITWKDVVGWGVTILVAILANIVIKQL